MKRLITLIAVVFLPVLVTVRTTTQPVSAAPNHRPSRAVCGTPGPHTARCLARVVTTTTGETASPLVSPDAVVGSLGPVAFHTAYNLPCTPGGSVQSVCATPAAFGPETIAIVDATNDPNVAADLSTYDQHYGLPACTKANGCLTVLNQNGGTTLPTSTDSGWVLEMSLDVQVAHTICQTCKILLLEGNSASFSDLGAAVNTAASMGATAISNSYGSNEWSGESSMDSTYNHPGVAVVASTGDTGNVVSYPASSPNVVGVGGTTLSINSDNTYSSESVWNGAGSGCSVDENAGSWQTGVADWSQTGCGTMRGTADVSADADPSSGAAVYDSVPYYGSTGWYQVGGTSLASPIVASVFALGGGVPSGANAPAFLYSTLNSTNSHDITSGSNGTCGTIMCTGATGYDGPTGLGSPNGASGFSSGTLPPPPTPSPTNTSGPSDFQLTASPSSQKVQQGHGGSYTTTLTALGSYNSSVKLSVSGLPAGASASFSANPVVPGSSGTNDTMQVKTGNTTPGGTYTLTITGTGADPAQTTHSTQVTLVVPAFMLGLSQPALTIKRGTSGTQGVTVTGLGGFTSPVTLSVSGLATKTSGSFSPNPVTPGGASTLTLNVQAGAGTGTRTVTVTGSGTGATQQKATFTLTIT